jgi:hypothetical protein
VDLPEQVVPQNPSVATNPFNSIHNDTWATDSYNLISPKEPLTAKVESLFTGGDCATITFNSRGELVTSVLDADTKVVAYLIDPATLRVWSRGLWVNGDRV